MEVRRCRLDLRTWIQPRVEPWKGLHWASRELGARAEALPVFPASVAVFCPLGTMFSSVPGVVCCALLAWQLSLHGSVIHPSIHLCSPPLGQWAPCLAWGL